MELALKMIEDAIGADPFDLGNSVLYDLCGRYPTHRSAQEVIAKVWLIGRSYAAAIERRRDPRIHRKGAHESVTPPRPSVPSEEFYAHSVAPKIMASDIDLWISQAQACKPGAPGTLSEVLRVHLQITRLLSSISLLDQRSLASKYLHFHAPQVAFLYDSRAVRALGRLVSVVGKAPAPRGNADPDYAKLCHKCVRLQDHVMDRFGLALTPRQIDQLLLKIDAQPRHPA